MPEIELSLPFPAHEAAMPRSGPTPAGSADAGSVGRDGGAQTNAHRRLRHYTGRTFLALGPVLLALAVTGILSVAWVYRDEGHLTAESGAGYWLGIVGGSMMLLLLLYPLRKHWRPMHRAGRVAGWFRLHMVMGILGPLLVVLHSNFKLGSLNSTLAMVTMLIVVTSGIVGRYFYAKVHRGLYGSQQTAREIASDLAALEAELQTAIGRNIAVAAELRALSQDALQAHRGFARALAKAVSTGLALMRTRPRVRSSMRRAILELARTKGLSRAERRRIERDVDGALSVYFRALGTAGRLALFERLLSMWHVLHLPLFILLALTASIHILAVHLY